MKTVKNILVLGFYGVWIAVYVKLLIFGEIQYYVSPIMNFLSWLQLLFWALLFSVSFGFAVTGSSLKLNLKSIILIIPVVFIFLTTSQVLSEGRMDRNFERLVGTDQLPQASVDTGYMFPEQWVTNQAGTNTFEDYHRFDLVLTNEDSIYYYLNDFYDRPEFYTGQTVLMKGILYKDDSFQSDQAFIGWYVIVCCIADAVVGGIFIRGDEISEFEKGSWILAEGEIGYETVSGEVSPVIYLSGLHSTVESNPYLYPGWMGYNLDDFVNVH